MFIQMYLQKVDEKRNEFRITSIPKFRNGGCESIFVSIVCHPATHIPKFRDVGWGCSLIDLFYSVVPQTFIFFFQNLWPIK